MPICAVRLPAVRIYEDFDKMSANEQQMAARLASDAESMPRDDSDEERVSIRFIAAMAEQDYLSSTEEDAAAQPRPPRTRKRSTSNINYKASKAFHDHYSENPRKRDCIASDEQPTSSAPVVNVMLSAGRRDGLRRQLLVRRSPSPSQIPGGRRARTSPKISAGYAQYQRALLEVPMPRDYGEASSDDLSSEWDSDFPEPQRASKVFIFSNQVPPTP